MSHPPSSLADRVDAAPGPAAAAPLIERVLAPFRRFAHTASAGGIVLGLVVGKPLGITLASWLAVRTGLASLPHGVTWRALLGVSWLGGIGFTMSLFIAGLALAAAPELLTAAKLGILGASLLAGVGGGLVLLRAPRTAAP